MLGRDRAFAAVLRDDAILTMPPMAAWYAGRAAIAEFVAWMRAQTGGFRCVATTLSGGPAIAIYARVPNEDRWVASSLHVLVSEGDRLSEVHASLLPQLFERLGLPSSL
jgi:RNA polymerase sigma-70 factor, ECF subfamily